MENEKTVIPVSEFCELYKMPKSTVYRKIKEHAESELSGHIIKKGKKSVFLDDFAVRFLCPQVVPVKTLDDQFSEIRRAIEDSKKETVGIKEDVSKMAEELEAAGKAKNLEFINENNPKLIQRYRSYIEKLSRLDEV